MAARTLTPSAPLIQGAVAPDIVINPDAFYAATRRIRFAAKPLTTFAGLGSTDTLQLRQTGIVDRLQVRVKGTLTFGGTITGTSMSYAWPFNLVQEIRLSANGQSNLIRARGITVRVLQFVRSPDLSDSGISKTYGGSAVSAGTLALPSDDWGTASSNALSPGTAVPATGAYTVDLVFEIPVSADPISLIGAIFAQSQATNLNLDVQWATQNDLLTLGGSATLAVSLQYKVTAICYSIPSVGGRFVVPDLSQFHQIVDNRVGGLAQGVNELVLPGTGVGRRLLRLLTQVYSGATPTPLAMNDANYSTVGWAYGGNDVPESYAAGGDLRADNILGTGCDIGNPWGFGLWDFASQFALRDVVDQGATSDLRAQLGLVSSPTSGVAQITQETLFAAAVGA